MEKHKESEGIAKLATGIDGFDVVTNGGLPQGRTTLVAGTSGSAKTVLACQYLVEGIRAGQGGVFVTFEESPAEIRRNMAGFGWDIDSLEARGSWRFVDVSAQGAEDSIVGGRYDLGALMARIEHAVRQVGAERLSMDSLGSVFSRLDDAVTIRNEMGRIGNALKKMGVTSLMTAERTEEYGSIARYGIEEFVADNVMVLRNVLEQEKRRRTLEILKFRGTTHLKGEYPFIITPDAGLVVIPLVITDSEQEATENRVSSGCAELDEMCGGGFFRDSIIMASGATGTGKTLMVTHFMDAGVREGHKCLLFAFEESRSQLIRNAMGWGVDFRAMEDQGLLRLVCLYPEMASLEEHLVTIRDQVEEYQPDQVAVDSLSALERISTVRGYREFVIGLTSYLKNRGITAVYTLATPALLGSASATEAHLSSLTDSIILLCYVELGGMMRRGVTVLKMRGSAHEKTICEFTIDGSGMHVGEPFQGLHGIMAGSPVHVSIPMGSPPEAEGEASEQGGQ